MDLVDGVPRNILGTVAMIALLAVAHGVAMRRLRRPRLPDVILGLAFAGASVAEMFDPLLVLDGGLVLDLRNLPLVLAGAFLGLPGLLLALGPALLAQLALGGAGAAAGAAGLVLSGLAGLLWRRWRGRLRGLPAIATLAALPLLHWASAALVPPRLLASLLAPEVLLHAAVEVLAILMLGALFEREWRLGEERRLLARDADHDELTGLLNRRGLAGAVAGLSPRQGGALLLIDLDHFKGVNDLHGHSGGDAVLRGMARRLGQVLRRQDLAARLGGEEIAVVLPDVSAGEAGAAARRLCEAIRSEPFALPGGGGVAVTASVGGAWGHPLRLDHLLARADAELYRAKSAGRDRVRFAGEDGPKTAGAAHAAAPLESSPPFRREVAPTAAQ